MAGDIKNKYGTNNQAITITLTNLADNAQRESTVIDNTSNCFIDALVFFHDIKTGDTGVNAAGFLIVYAYGTADGGTNYGDTCTGSDALVTLTVPPNLKIIGIINAVANATAYRAGPFSVANAFGGVLPDKWGIVVENQTDHHLDAVAGGNVFYQGVYGQYT